MTKTEKRDSSAEFIYFAIPYYLLSILVAFVRALLLLPERAMDCPFFLETP
jgi:hypothetical protein